MGVAFVAAGLSLGVCLGVTFTKGPKKREFNLLENARWYPEDVPDDIAEEVFDALAPCYQAQPGEWLLVYGGERAASEESGIEEIWHGVLTLFLRSIHCYGTDRDSAGENRRLKSSRRC